MKTNIVKPPHRRRTDGNSSQTFQTNSNKFIMPETRFTDIPADSIALSLDEADRHFLDYCAKELKLCHPPLTPFMLNALLLSLENEANKRFEEKWGVQQKEVNLYQQQLEQQTNQQQTQQQAHQQPNFQNHLNTLSDINFLSEISINIKEICKVFNIHHPCSSNESMAKTIHEAVHGHWMEKRKALGTALISTLRKNKVETEHQPVYYSRLGSHQHASASASSGISSHSRSTSKNIQAQQQQQQQQQHHDHKIVPGSLENSIVGENDEAFISRDIPNPLVIFRQPLSASQGVTILRNQQQQQQQNQQQQRNSFLSALQIVNSQQSMINLSQKEESNQAQISMQGDMNAMIRYVKEALALAKAVKQREELRMLHTEVAVAELALSRQCRRLPATALSSSGGVATTISGDAAAAASSKLNSPSKNQNQNQQQQQNYLSNRPPLMPLIDPVSLEVRQKIFSASSSSSGSSNVNNNNGLTPQSQLGITNQEMNTFTRTFEESGLCHQ